MAGDWIKVEHWTPDKPEIFRLADELEIDPDAVVGKLVRLWVWADQHTIDGNAASVTESLLDRISGVTGFAQAMIAVGWMQKTDAGYAFTHFERHNGQTAKTRALSRERAAKHRSGNAGVTDEQRRCNAASVTESLPEKRREEKRREDPELRAAHAADAATEKPKRRQSQNAPPEILKEILEQFALCTGRHAEWTPKRKAQANARWRDLVWRERWREAMDRAGQSSFCNGGGPQAWVMDLEFFLRPDTVTKILEGKYDDREGAPNGRKTFGHAAAEREAANADAFAVLGAAVAAASRHEGISGPEQYIAAPVCIEEPVTVHGVRVGNVGRDSQHLPY